MEEDEIAVLPPFKSRNITYLFIMKYIEYWYPYSTRTKWNNADEYGYHFCRFFDTKVLVPILSDGHSQRT